MERDDKGRFVKGVSGNPAGRARREVEHTYHEAMVAKVSIADWQAIVDRAVKDAKIGDANARSFLANYLIGKPQGRLDITSNDEQILPGLPNMTDEQLDKLTLTLN